MDLPVYFCLIMLKLRLFISVCGSTYQEMIKYFFIGKRCYMCFIWITQVALFLLNFWASNKREFKFIKHCIFLKIYVDMLQFFCICKPCSICTPCCTPGRGCLQCILVVRSNACNIFSGSTNVFSSQFHISLFITNKNYTRTKTSILEWGNSLYSFKKKLVDWKPSHNLAKWSIRPNFQCSNIICDNICFPRLKNKLNSQKLSW
jgi:hypothetical protein